MKCACGGKLRKIKTKIGKLGSEITVNNVDAYYCPSCKEELLTTNQAAKAQERVYKTLPHSESYAMQTEIYTFGNRLAIPLARELANYMGLDKGDAVRITVKNRGRLIVDVLPHTQ